MLTKVVARTSLASDEELTLTLGSLSEPIQIRDINGLGPVKASISTAPFGNTDGDYYSGSSVGARNIVLTLGLNPTWSDQSYESLRELLYVYFMPKAPIRLIFFRDDKETVYIDGYVESFDPNIFSKDPEVQISIINPQPDFIGVYEVSRSGITQVSSLLIDYVGTEPTGFYLLLDKLSGEGTYSDKLLVSIQQLLVDDVIDQQLFSIDPISVTVPHSFEMSTVPRNSYVRTFDSGGDPINIIRNMDPTSVWPRLKIGENRLSILTPDDGAVRLRWILRYQNRYGGI